MGLVVRHNTIVQSMLGAVKIHRLTSIELELFQAAKNQCLSALLSKID
jgi:hypothetical protein